MRFMSNLSTFAQSCDVFNFIGVLWDMVSATCLPAGGADTEQIVELISEIQAVVVISCLDTNMAGSFSNANISTSL